MLPAALCSALVRSGAPTARLLRVVVSLLSGLIVADFAVALAVVRRYGVRVMEDADVLAEHIARAVRTSVTGALPTPRGAALMRAVDSAISAEIAALSTAIRDLRRMRDGRVLCAVLDYRVPPPPARYTPDALPESPGVYFLWNTTRTIGYVGQSLNVRKRVAKHWADDATGKWCDSDLVSCLDFPESDLLWAEAFYIGAFRPLRNGGVRAVTWFDSPRQHRVLESLARLSEQPG